VGEVRTLERRRARGDEAVERAVADLPDGVDDPRAGAVAAVDRGEGAPDDAVGDGDELLGNRHTTIIAQLELYI
jgi:hypothetical protein